MKKDRKIVFFFVPTKQDGFVYLAALIAAVIVLVSSVGIYMWAIRGKTSTEHEKNRRTLSLNIRSAFEEARSAATDGFNPNGRSYWRIGLLQKSYTKIILQPPINTPFGT